MIQQRLKRTDALSVTARHEECAFTESFGLKFAQRSRTEQDAIRGGELKSLVSYQSLSSGKTLEYFKLLRGSAIIGATMSRHL